VNFLSFITHH